MLDRLGPVGPLNDHRRLGKSGLPVALSDGHVPDDVVRRIGMDFWGSRQKIDRGVVENRKNFIGDDNLLPGGFGLRPGLSQNDRDDIT